MIRLLLFAILFASCNQSPQKNSDIPKDTLDQAAIEREILEQAKPAYVEAYKEISMLKIHVELAEKGTLNASDVVKEFNNSVGLTMGQLKTLSAVKHRLDSAGDGYIKMKHLNAAAEIASGRAAESQFKADALRSEN